MFGIAAGVEHVAIKLKLPYGSSAFPGERPNVLTALTETGEGHLIFCRRCLEKVHCATFVAPAEVAARLAAFTEKHRNCKP